MMTIGAAPRLLVALACRIVCGAASRLVAALGEGSVWSWGASHRTPRLLVVLAAGTASGAAARLPVVLAARIASDAACG